MKKLIFYFIGFVSLLCSLISFSQNGKDPVALGLPGDNFNLYAVLNVFEKSATLEAFERALNDKDTAINNLDLNSDNAIDYIQVISYKEGETYSIVLRTPISDKENQDIAVLIVTKNNDGKVLVQIIGDEELYGKNYIIEPASEAVSETPNPGYKKDPDITINTAPTYNLNGVYYANDWPIVSFLFSTGFTIYISPWYWGYYPSYWQPWIPIYYYNYWNFHNHYYHNHYYRRAVYVRYPNSYSYYSRRRVTSPTVIQNRRTGSYRSTYEGKTYPQPEAPISRTTRKSKTTTTRIRTNENSSQRNKQQTNERRNVPEAQPSNRSNQRQERESRRNTRRNTR